MTLKRDKEGHLQNRNPAKGHKFFLGFLGACVIAIIISLVASSCSSSTTGGSSGSGGTSSSAQENHGCGLPKIHTNKHRSRAEVRRYARKARECAIRKHRQFYYAAPGDKICLDSAFIPYSHGASLQGPVTVSDTVVPGNSYTTNKVYYANTGSSGNTFVFRVKNDLPYCENVLSPSWVTGTGNPISLGAGHHGYAQFDVKVPAGTRPGVYKSDMEFVGTSSTGGKENNEAGIAVPIIINVK